MSARFFATDHQPTQAGGTVIFRGTIRRVKYGMPHEQDVTTLYRMASAALSTPLGTVRYRSVTFDSPTIGHHTVTLSTDPKTSGLTYAV